MTIMKTFALTTAAAALIGASAASAQVFGDEIGTDYGYDGFERGFAETGYYDALDRDGDEMLSENEYATGLFTDYDRDADMMVSEDEFATGTQRYMGDAYDGGQFADYDANADGMVDRSEFRNFYGTEYTSMYTGADGDADGMLNRDEYGSSVYNTADADRDQVITIEEEGFFEGWFDGDDIEARVREVGDLM